MFTRLSFISSFWWCSSPINLRFTFEHTQNPEAASTVTRSAIKFPSGTFSHARGFNGASARMTSLSDGPSSLRPLFKALCKRFADADDMEDTYSDISSARWSKRAGPELHEVDPIVWTPWLWGVHFGDIRRRERLVDSFPSHTVLQVDLWRTWSTLRQQWLQEVEQTSPARQERFHVALSSFQIARRQSQFYPTPGKGRRLEHMSAAWHRRALFCKQSSVSSSQILKSQTWDGKKLCTY